MAPFGKPRPRLRAPEGEAWKSSILTVFKTRFPVIDPFHRAGEQRVGGLLRLQRLRPERHHRGPPRDREHVLRHRVQRPRPAALARRGTRCRRADLGRELHDAGFKRVGFQAHPDAEAHVGAERGLKKKSKNPEHRHIMVGRDGMRDLEHFFTGTFKTQEGEKKGDVECLPMSAVSLPGRSGDDVLIKL